MATTRQISRAEWEVLDVLWRQPHSSAREVAEALATTKSWSRKTVLTFLARLVEKGIAVVRTDGRVNRYRVRESREKWIARESASFLQRIFRGACGPMLAHFCEQNDLTPADIARLEEILNRKKK
jgi:BlaI family penicillinase repressor